MKQTRESKQCMLITAISIIFFFTLPAISLWAAVPNAPSWLTATALSSTQIQLTWTDNSTDETRFYIERKTGVSGTYSQITYVGTDATSYTNTGLTQNTEYYYRVRAYNASGYSAYSNEEAAMTPTLNAPSNLTVTLLSSYQIGLTWTDNSSDETSFYIERKTGASGTYSTVTSVGVNVTTYTDSSVLDNTEYYYRVRAYNGNAYSAYSNEVNATTLILSAPSNLTATALSYSQIKITWTDNSPDETSFYIERKTGASGTYSTVATAGANTTSYTDSSALQNTEYYYRVRAYNGNGYSEYSNEAVATTPPLILNAPSNLTASPLSSSQIKLTWTDNSAEELYFYIERKTGASGTYSYLTSVGVNVTTYTDFSVSDNTEYYYRVRAYGAGLYSEYSNEVPATTLPLNAPSDLTAEPISCSEMKLTWKDNSTDESRFYIEYKMEGGTYKNLTYVYGNTTTYTHSGLIPNTKYYYRVRAYGSPNYSPYSNEAYATTIMPPEYELHSKKIALVPSADGRYDYGGTLPTSFNCYVPTFVNVSVESIRDNATDPLVSGGYDTVALVGICDINSFLSNNRFKSRIENFVFNGGKLIIWDSECRGTDYSQFIFPFITSNPGQMGSTGVLADLEENTLSSKDTLSDNYINVSYVSEQTTAVGDSNVMVTQDPNWCIDMTAENSNDVTGPVHTYAPYGQGLIIYDGFDKTDMYTGQMIGTADGVQNLGKIWMLELKQAWNPVPIDPVTGNSVLPCLVPVTGLQLTPESATTPINNYHTLTAKVVDQMGSPVSGITVTFTVKSGPHAGTGGTGVTDTSGIATFSYKGILVGVDNIEASATLSGNTVKSKTVKNEWFFALTDVRIIDTISNADITVDELSISPTPYSISQMGDSIIIEWRYTYLSIGQINDISLYVNLLDPIPGEDRLVNQKLTVYYTDVNGNPVMTELGPQYVHVLNSAFDSNISTDKPVYQASEDVAITALITNLSEYARTIDAKVLIEDSQGVFVKEVTTLSNLNFTEGETKNFSNLTFNTSSTLAGDYRVHLILYENQKQVGEAFANFTIAATKDISSNITTDKMAYSANQPATLTSTVTSLSENTFIENLTAAVTIKNGQGTPLFTDQKTISILLPGESSTLNTYWNTSTNPPGDYPVTLEVKDAAGNLLSTSTTNLTIESTFDPKKLLIGQISVDKRSLLMGEPVNISYSITNKGNMDLSEINLSIPVVHVVKLIPYDTLTDQTALLMSETFTNTQSLDTHNYTAKDYLVILRANISGIEETLASTYFRVEGAPSAPSLSWPSEAEDIETLTPSLTVNNAADHNDDDLTYQFELYSDSGLENLLASSDMIAETQNTTSWTAPFNLTENNRYYWRARAYDGLLYGDWMIPASFRINLTNEPPTAPTLSSPADNSSVDTLTPLLVVNNAYDPDSENLTYNFELSLDSEFTQILASEIGIFEGEGTTAWDLPVNLTENTWHYWRAQAVDNLIDNTYYYVRAKASDGIAESAWSDVIRFFVNTINDAPSIPVLSNPSDGSGVNTFNPALSVHNSFDIDGDLLTYEFELYEDEAMLNLIASAAAIAETPDITSWTTPINLTENKSYYWRARAYDGELYSGWMPLASFMVNTANDAPGAPTLHSPSDGSSIDTLTPALSVYNATDPDSDLLTYDFEVYSNGALIQSITGVPQNLSGITSASLTTALTDNTTYNWRARAYDGDRYGAWMDMAEFSVHLPVTNITGTIDFDPNTLNQKSQGKWVVVYIELPQGYNVSDIIISSILFEGTIPAEPWPYNIGDYDKDGISDLMVKFKRADVINLLPNGDNIIVHVKGIVGTKTFEGFDIIRVIH